MISESKPLLNDVIDQLTTNYNFLRFVEQMYQVKCSHSGSELYVDSISFEQVCLELDLSPDNLIKKINKSLDQNTELLKTLCCV